MIASGIKKGELVESRCIKVFIYLVLLPETKEQMQ